MNNEHKPPTTQDEALRMIAPLDPAMPKNAYSPEETEVAFQRLMNFITSLLPE